MRRQPLAGLLLVALLAGFARAAGEKTGEIPKLGSINAPLSNTLPTNPGGALNLNNDIPTLPQTAVNVGQNVTGAAIQQTGSAYGVNPTSFGRKGTAEPTAQTAAAPANPPNNGGATAAAPAPPAGPPYFVEALVNLGTPRDLALELAAYQETRHPGDQNKIYHGLTHSQDVPNLVARALAGPAGYTLTFQQKAMLITAAIFHDIDPERVPETPARVAATLAYLDKDADSARLLAAVGKAHNFNAAQIKALIKATDFNADPEKQKAITADLQKMAAEAFPTPEKTAWALDWGQKLSFFDKSATYVGSVASAEKQVINLAHEIRKGIEAATGKPVVEPSAETMLKGSAAFLKSLTDSPHFALMPKAQQENFKAVVARFDDIKAGNVDLAKLILARGPPLAAELALANAKKDVAGLLDQNPAAVVAPKATAPAVFTPPVPLQRLKDEGFDLLNGNQVATREEQEMLLAGIDRLFPDGIDTQLNNIFELLKKEPQLSAILASIEKRLTAHVETATPGEKIRRAQFSIRAGEHPLQGLHPDGGYLTAVFTLRGDGTKLYHPDDEGGVREIRAEQGSVAVLSASGREAATGIPTTIHAAGGKDSKRVILLLRYSDISPTTGKATSVDDETKKKIGARMDAVRKALQTRKTNPAVEKLKEMKRSGAAVIPAFALLTKKMTAAVLAAVDAQWQKDSIFNTWELHNRFENPQWRETAKQTPEVLGHIRSFVETITPLIQDALPDEGVKLYDVQMRLGNEQSLQANQLHVDGNYITVTMALRGPSTKIYFEREDGRVETVRPPTGEAVVISNTDREWITGIRGTVHSVPEPTDPQRVLLIIRYSSAASEKITDDERKRVDVKPDARTLRYERLLQAQEKSRSKAPTGTSSLWKKLFGE